MIRPTTRISPARLIGALYFLAVLVMGIRAGVPTEFLWWLGAIPFLIWCASPVLVGLWVARRLTKGLGSIIYIALIAAIGVAGFAEQWWVLFIGPSDAQNALVMAFVPLLQWVAVGGVILVTYFLRHYVFKS